MSTRNVRDDQWWNETYDDDDEDDVEQLIGDEANDRFLPPRTYVHPSNKGKLTHWFYGSLLFAFISLLIFLLIWGIQQMPD